MTEQPSATMTLEDFFQFVYRPLRLPDASANTLRLYENTLTNVQKYLGRHGRLDDLTDEWVSLFMAWMLDRGRSPVTANSNRRRLVALWNFACRKRLLDEWPTVRKLREPQRTPVAYSLDELAKLLGACLKAEGELYPGLPAGPWWYALHLVLWDTGERIACIRGLLWTDVDLAGGWLHARAELRKGGRADRTYKLRRETVEAIERIRQPERPEIFPFPREDHWLYYHYGKILRAAGLPTSRMDKFHKVRKSVGTHGLAAGADAATLLDHTDIRVTKKYLDPRYSGQVFAADLLPSIAPKSKGGAA